MHTLLSRWRLILAGFGMAGWIFPFLAATGTAQSSVPDELFGDAVLQDWVQPAYPAAAAKARQQGQVTVEFIVEEDGLVSEAGIHESTDAVFDESALAAVRKWKFHPAVEKGKPVRSAMRVRVLFQLEQLKQKRVPISPPDHLRPAGIKPTAARPVVAPDPDYPDELMVRKLPGRVDLAFTVDEKGRTAAPRVHWASHAAFVESALLAVSRMEFEPARQGPIAKVTTVESPMTFGEFGLKRADTLAANRFTVVSLPEGATPPGPFVLPEPVHPFEHVMVGGGGSASAEFEVDARGLVRDVTSKEASAPEFGAALLAAIEAWMFQPAREGPTAVPARLSVAWEFTPPTEGAAGRLADLLRPGGAGVGSASSLDRRLAPLWRGFPVYPATLLAERPAGQAEIEFIIDRNGRARYPRVVKATHEAFGWAAATAISQWVFAPPMRNGEAVDVRVSIPVNFNPPAN